MEATLAHAHTRSPRDCAGVPAIDRNGTRTATQGRCFQYDPGKVPASTEKNRLQTAGGGHCARAGAASHGPP
jgi:hypothetical protein